MQVPETDCRRSTWLHRLPPGLKLGSALALLVFIVLLPRKPHPLYLVPAFLVLALWLGCRMPAPYALRRLLVVEFFIVGIVLLSVMNPAAWPLLLSVLAKSNLCALTMLVLTWTTPFQEILVQLRWLRLPTVILTTLALMYRYLPVLAEESRRMQRARASRTFARRRRFAWHSLANLIGRLFVRTADRAERIYLAMCARGWK